MLGIRTVNKIRSKLSDFCSVPFCGRKHSLSFLGNFRLKGQCHEIFCFRFFSSITFPQGPENNIRSFRIFSKIRGDIRKSRCKSRCKFATGVNDTGGKLPPVSTTPAANFATSSACVVDIGGKFSTSVNHTGGK
jgi:hypothetical protein